jgi:hypothetical protein
VLGVSPQLKSEREKPMLRGVTHCTLECVRRVLVTGRNGRVLRACRNVRVLSARSAEVRKCARGPAEVVVDSKALLVSGQSAKLAQERQVLSRILYSPPI